MKKIIFSVIFLLAVGAAFFSCEDDFQKKSRDAELKELNEYIAKNYPNGIEPTASGLYFIEKQKGFGDTIKVGDKVQIFYATMALDSFLFDETVGFSSGYRYEPYEIIVGAGNSVLGLEEGLTYMQPGAKASLIINSELAYGNGSFNAPLPGFTTLLMEVEIYKVFPVETSEEEETD